MNESITPIQSNELLNKIRHDLNFGYKVLGNYINQVDIIRVWCRILTSEKVFAIVATSGNRFNNSSSVLELQSFGPDSNYKIAFLIINKNLNETTISSTTKGNHYQIEDFIREFMLTSPDQELTSYKLSVDGYNPKDIEWVSR